MNDPFKYIIEENWININKLDISKDFFNSIKYNDRKLIEQKRDIIKFVYVGVLVYKDEIIIILPKYYNGLTVNGLKITRDLINVFKKIPNSIVNENNNSLMVSTNLDDDEISEIALADYIIKDYIKNGYYIKKNLESKLNCSGRIDWNKTINKTVPIISNGYPIYNYCFSVKNRINYDDEVYMIHKSIVNICINKYAILLGYNIKGESYKKSLLELKKIGNEKKIVTIIKNELTRMYSDREISLLKCIYKFFDPSREKSNKSLNIYGTTSFNLVWEHICGYIFDNEYENYKDDIPIPRWEKVDGKQVENLKNTLNPDIIKRCDDTIMIIDAKYYSIKLTEYDIKGNPGTYDIVKQYTYEMAIRKKYEQFNIMNILAYPKKMKVNWDIFGTVSLDIFNLKPIVNIFFNPEYIINLYLETKKLNPNELRSIIRGSTND